MRTAPKLFPGGAVIATGVGAISSFRPVRSLAKRLVTSASRGGIDLNPFDSDTCAPGYRHKLEYESGVGYRRTGRCVRIRRMNIANARALRRSIRRGKGFLKLTRRVVGLYQAKPRKGRRYLKGK